MGEKAWLEISLYLQVLMLTGWSDIWCCGTRAACLWQQPGTGGWAWQLQFCQTQIRPRWRGIGHGSYHVGSAKHGLSQHSCRTKRETFSRTKSHLSKGVNDIKHNCIHKATNFFCTYMVKFFPLSLYLDLKVPAKIAVWFLETGRFPPVSIRVPWFLFWFWMQKKVLYLEVYLTT